MLAVNRKRNLPISLLSYQSSEALSFIFNNLFLEAFAVLFIFIDQTPSQYILLFYIYIHNTRFWTSLRIVNRQLWHIPCFQSPEIKFQMMTKGNWKPCLSCRGYSHPNYGTPYRQEKYELPVKFIKKLKQSRTQW